MENGQRVLQWGILATHSLRLALLELSSLFMLCLNSFTHACIHIRMQVDAAVEAAKAAPVPPMEWMWRNM